MVDSIEFICRKEKFTRVKEKSLKNCENCENAQNSLAHRFVLYISVNILFQFKVSCSLQTQYGVIAKHDVDMNILEYANHARSL